MGSEEAKTVSSVIDGNTLSVTLFFLGTAVDLVLATLNTEYWWVRILLRSIAGILVVSAFAWPFLSKFSPTFTASMISLTSSAWAWFILLMGMAFVVSLLPVMKYWRTDQLLSQSSPISSVNSVNSVEWMKGAGIKVLPLLPFPIGYDRLIPARSRQDEVEEGYEQAKQIWAASIAGVYFSHLRDEDRKKITQVLLVDPGSALMETLIRIQPLRGEDMPVNVKRAVKICKDEKIEVRLSSHPLLNVVLFDPGTPHAWARVQEFIPYFQGEESVVYAIRKEEWEDLYNKTESSFKQAWKNGRDPEDIH